MSAVPKNLELYAADIERRGRRNGHELGDWHRVELVLDFVPPEAELRGAVAGEAMPRPRITCSCCDAWAAFVTDDGMTCNSQDFDQPCLKQKGIPTA